MDRATKNKKHKYKPSASELLKMLKIASLYHLGVPPHILGHYFGMPSSKIRGCFKKAYLHFWMDVERSEDRVKRMEGNQIMSVKGWEKDRKSVARIEVLLKPTPVFFKTM